MMQNRREQMVSGAAGKNSLVDRTSPPRSPFATANDVKIKI
jgi:hypothetical protein